LLTLLLLTLVLPAPLSLTAGARPAQAAAKDNKGDRDDKGDKDDKAWRDPCRKALKHAPQGKEFPPECKTGSSSGIARGDFNNDDIGDLAVGIPFEDTGNAQDAGAVHIIYGSTGGLSATAGPGDQFLHQDSTGIQDTAEAGDRFGAALAAGDFDGNGFSDLAVGVPGENGNAGRLHLLYGTDGGLVGADSLGFVEVIQRFPATPGDEFGAALAWGNFDGDLFGDLAVGVPGRNQQAGEVFVSYGGPDGLGSPLNSQSWSQDSADILGALEAGDRFGAALTAGDFGGDGSSDLAVGAPGEDLAADDAGAVNVIYGSFAFGLRALDNQFWSQDSTGIIDSSEAHDQFGAALAAVGFNGSDLAVGVPGEDVGTAVDAGAVTVIYRGSGSTLSATGNQFWSQNSKDIQNAAETGDQFGAALAAGDFDGDGLRDLAIGVPGEDFATRTTITPDAGAVSVIYYAGGVGLSATAGPGNQFWHQSVTGVPDAAEAGDRFGSALTAWNFGNGTLADLAVGVPFEDVGGIQGAGAVTVIYGDNTNFPPGLRAAGSQFWHQDSPDIDDSAEAGDQFGRALY
jgi:hypothetical protein